MISSYLFVFESGGLWKALKDINLFSICIQGKDMLLIEKVYESKNNFSYCVSSFLYLNIRKEICINNYKEIFDMKIDLFKPLDNVY